MIERSGAVERSATVERSRRVEKSGAVERFDMAAVTSITALGVGKLPPAVVGTWSPLRRTCEERRSQQLPSRWAKHPWRQWMLGCPFKS